jgi:hypothetical protein
MNMYELAHLGIQAEVTSQGRLRLQAPRGTLTQELRERLAASRDHLIDEISREREPVNLVNIDSYCLGSASGAGVAAIDGNSAAPSAANLTRWSLNTRETDLSALRLVHFVSIGEAHPRELADRLVQRDRDRDDRHLCVECNNNTGAHCNRNFAVLDVLQRCDEFCLHVDLGPGAPMNPADRVGHLALDNRDCVQIAGGAPASDVGMGK